MHNELCAYSLSDFLLLFIFTRCKYKQSPGIGSGKKWYWTTLVISSHTSKCAQLSIAFMIFYRAHKHHYVTKQRVKPVASFLMQLELSIFVIPNLFNLTLSYASTGSKLGPLVQNSNSQKSITGRPHVDCINYIF